ncbi:Flavodoxin [Spironucleus salmonicida]|uniref:Flavodoxin n=1 Tax=Spironucleus salmonicida TaxID=348837 RepID=V6LWM2_9EUKA|nr:Flavodoxin [Spironucleus salmonicida]|eukprot:EST48648.1 Flavodoxin [Spironucleus salmonicida]
MFAIPNYPILIIYATQTGTTKQIAKDLHSNLQNQGFQAILKQINGLKPSDLTGVSAFIFATSTYGAGEFPQMAIRPLAEFKTPAFAQHFKGLKYGIFGVGSTEFASFCSAADAAERLFEGLGCRKIIEIGRLDRARKLGDQQAGGVLGWCDEFARFVQPVDGMTICREIETIFEE